jgi:DNA ligase (NAD+)
LTDFGQRTHADKHKILKTLGLKTNNKYSKYCKNLKEVFNFHKITQSLREKFPYEIDGITVIVNNNEIFEKLGIVGKAPRGAIAYKFPLKQATTIIKDIKIQVGRTGALTPVAILNPVEIGGVVITRATLHNDDEIKKLGVKIGDTVIVGRAGDVIPDIVQVLPELRNGGEKEFKMPRECPACGTKVIKLKGKVVYRCPNPNCQAKKRRYFYHFVSKGAFDIVGLGPKVIDRLLDGGIISDPVDLFNIRQNDILQLERFAEKSSKNLIGAIQNKKIITLPRFIYALGIRNVGAETAHDLAEYFGSIEKIKKADFNELQKIKDIGPVVAQSIYDWFSKKRNLEFFDKIKRIGVEIVAEKKPLNRSLKGKTFVLTGILKTMTRREAKERIRTLGGKISESISKKINFVIVGKEPGSKYERAKKLGVRIINEKEFFAMLKD